MATTDLSIVEDGVTKKTRLIAGAESAASAETQSCVITHLTAYNGQFQITPIESDASDGDIIYLAAPSTASASSPGELNLPYGFKTTTVGANTKAADSWRLATKIAASPSPRGYRKS